MKVEELPSKLRLGLTLTIALGVVSSSPIIVFENLGFANPSSSSSSYSNDPTTEFPSTVSQGLLSATK